MPSFLVVNLRGLVNTPTGVRETLKNLHLETRFRATVVPDTPDYRGMLQRAKEHVAWCEAKPELTLKMIEKRGRVEGKTPITDDVLKALGYSKLSDLAKALSDGKTTLNAVGVKPSVALSPPKGGFRRSTRRLYSQGGVLGHNPELPKLVEAMI
ncbi:MAG: 50S ribosomal protein L30 [Thaumarchaeota archaeon]|nr:50S ribosomal protein L30 [Nitrososphaerota archaeon]